MTKETITLEMTMPEAWALLRAAQVGDHTNLTQGHKTPEALNWVLTRLFRLMKDRMEERR